MIQTTLYQTALRFLGLKEIPGPKNNGFITWCLSLCSLPDEPDETPWCFDGEVEVLTECGFVKFKDVDYGQKIAQVDKDTLVIHYIHPTEIIKNINYSGSIAHINNRDFSLVCDARHRFFGVWNKANSKLRKEIRPIADLTSSLHIPAIETDQPDNPLYSDSDLKLLAAFISDGFNRDLRWNIQVSKQKKVSFLNELGPTSQYTDKKCYGISVVPLTTFSFKVPNVLKNIWDEYKVPTYAFINSLSKRQLRVFLDTYYLFDGYKRNSSIQLYTSNPILRDRLQVCVTLAGYHSTWRISSISSFSGKPCYAIVYCQNKSTRYINKASVTFKEEERDLFCVSVPSGLIVIRDPSGTVIVTGNCSAFINGICYILGIDRSGSAAARSWLTVGVSIPLSEAMISNDIVILKRGPEPQPDKSVLNAPGHVGIFAGMDGPDKIKLLGGNQGDRVCVASFPISSILDIRRLSA